MTPPPDDANPIDPLHSPEADQRALADAREYLASYREGLLHFDSDHIEIKFVTDPESGRLVASVPVAAILAAQHVLFIPEEDEDAMQLLLSPEEIDECAATDRWMIHHGEPEHVRWAAFWIDSARLAMWVFDGDAFTESNPLRAHEVELCKFANQHTDALRTLCRNARDMEVESPRCVAIDARGMHIRARFGILRIPFDAPAENADDARARIQTLIDAADDNA